MRKISILLFVFINIFILNGCSQQNNDKFDTVIFYSPHADDEVLSMGASILQAKKADKRVVVILLSKGLASSALNRVNQQLADYDKKPITRKEFGEARVKEFKTSVQALGVAKKDIHVYNLPDGDFSTNEIAKLMEEFSNQFPKAEHHAMSYNDPHKDHATTGIALKSLIDEGKIQDGVFHLPIQEFEHLQYDEVDKVPFFSRLKYNKALDAYAIWDPNKGYYSIGKISVTDYFSKAEKERSSRWHE